MTTEQISEPAVQAVKPRTIHSIQALRALAAMLVVLFHGQLAFSTQIAEPGFAGESYLFAFGAVGVHIFFVISGFIMVLTSRFDGGFDPKAFMRRRLLRIYPIYWICVALYLIIYALMGTPYYLSLSETIGALLLYPGKAAEVIGPAWTLAFEMFFYICFAVAMMAGLNRGLLILSAAFVISILAGFVLPFDNSAWNLASSSLLLEFVAGAVIGWLLVRGHLPTRGGVLWMLLAGLLFAGGIFWGYNNLPSVLMWGIPSTVLIAGAVIVESDREAPIWVQRVGHFGDSSYALYLIHILVIAVLVEAAMPIAAMSKVEPAWAAFGIALVALICAELLHHRLEKPMLRRLYRRRASNSGSGQETD